MVPRRISTRVIVPRDRDTKFVSGPRVPVKDRWYYEAHESQGSSDVTQGSSDVHDDELNMLVNQAYDNSLILGPVTSDPVMLAAQSIAPPCVRLDQSHRRDPLRRFNLEGRIQRRLFRAASIREWDMVVAPAFDQGNQPSKDSLDAEVSFAGFMHHRLSHFDSDLAEKKASYIDDICSACPPFSSGVPPNNVNAATSAGLLQRPTEALWAGLRRVYFGEFELEDNTALDNDDCDISNTRR